MTTLLEPVHPTTPVAPWLGGKRNLAKRICTILDATELSRKRRAANLQRFGRA